MIHDVTVDYVFLQQIHVRNIGLWLAAVYFIPFAHARVTFIVRQLSGMFPFSIVKLYIMVKNRAILLASSFRIFGLMLSGQAALCSY